MEARVKKSCLIGFLSIIISIHLYAVEPNTVIAIINAGVNPASIAITPDSNTAYVANNNNYGLPGGDSVTVLNLKNNTVIQTIVDSSFNEPYRIAISKDGSKAYVANSNSTTITIINTATNTVSGIIDGFDGPSGIAITPDGTRAYVNNYGAPEGLGSGNAITVRVVDLINNRIIGDPIIVGLAPAALAITPDGKFVYVVNYVNGNPQAGAIAVIQTSTNEVVDTIFGLSGPFSIAITPDGKYAYVTNFGSNNFSPIGTTVSVVKLSTNEIVDTINLAIQPAGIAIAPNGKHAYVTNYNTLYAGSNFTALTAGQGTVNIIDLNTNEVIPPTIVVGQSPSTIVIAPNGKHAYVTNYTSNVVNVIALPSKHYG